MEPLVTGIVSAGAWPALPVTGWVICLRFIPQAKAFSPGTGVALATAIGIIPWSAAFLAAAVCKVYRPEVFGALGWLVFLGGLSSKGFRGWGRNCWDWSLNSLVFALGLCFLGFVYLLYPAETICCNRDMSVYANHGIFIAHHGRLDVPYPWTPAEHDILYPAMIAMPGFYKTPGTMTVQFGHLYPVWLAQVFATFGEGGVFRFNGFLALLALVMFYATAAGLVRHSYALGATFFLGFTPSQVWLARTSLSEIMAQLLIWSGLYCLLEALRTKERCLGAAAGFFMCFAVLARIDAILFLPCLLLGQLLQKMGPWDHQQGLPVWRSFFQVVIPLLPATLVYYWLFSTPYFEHLQPELVAAAITTAGCLAVWATMTVGPQSWRQKVHRWLSERRLADMVALGVAVLLLYAYWIRPGDEPFALIDRPDHGLHGTRV